MAQGRGVSSTYGNGWKISLSKKRNPNSIVKNSHIHHKRVAVGEGRVYVERPLHPRADKLCSFPMLEPVRVRLAAFLTSWPPAPSPGSPRSKGCCHPCGDPTRAQRWGRQITGQRGRWGDQAPAAPFLEHFKRKLKWKEGEATGLGRGRGPAAQEEPLRPRGLTCAARTWTFPQAASAHFAKRAQVWGNKAFAFYF